jgi:hypothetical protein
LNRTAAVVWRHCDGQRSPEDLAGLLQDQLDLPADLDLVWLALEHLDRAQLLSAPLEGHPSQRYSRRELTRKLARVGLAAALLPLVHSIVAPTPAHAQSGLPVNAPCETNAQCATNCCAVVIRGGVLVRVCSPAPFCA